MLRNAPLSIHEMPAAVSVHRRTAGWRPLAGACWCPLASSWPGGERRTQWPLQQQLLLRLTRATSYPRLLAGNDMACCPCPLTRCTRPSPSSPSRINAAPSPLPPSPRSFKELDRTWFHLHRILQVCCCAAPPAVHSPCFWLGPACLMGRTACAGDAHTAQQLPALTPCPAPSCLRRIADPGLCDGNCGPGPGLCTDGWLGGRGLE